VDAQGRLDLGAVERTLDALRDFRRLADEAGVRTVAAVGTSALRDAANGPEFVSKATNLLGGTVEVISGDREAELTYLAARRDPLIAARLAESASETVATMDSGGGSTEFVIGQGDHIVYRESLQIGAVRLTERAGFSDPPTREELDRAVVYADDALASVPTSEDGLILVASGGTVANLAGMEVAEADPRTPVTADTLHGTILTLAQVESRLQRLASVPLAERRQTPGLEPDRADVIVAGAIIQARALRHLGVDEVIASARGLRFGLLYSLLDDAERIY
jgi:exopolyphosphatase / guanosine-5'-triphosphate,3'-diphosphate pyrophosphatase